MSTATTQPPAPEKLFKDYKFEKGEIVIVVGPYLLDGVPFPFLASVLKPPSRNSQGRMQVKSQSGWFSVTPFNKPGLDLNEKNLWIATPFNYPKPTEAK